ncbi:MULTISPECIES: glycosyltransferase family 2 protein [unclassified Paenibacillus]|uniref:glycosyltransferase family 2 protein n=1 Tax=unclassified Paenibacillus TaxID=185978 RepID=UPI002404DE31|nr:MULTISPECIES: glycosyltransferase family 2 protein [unclassified Paenibacillus]MDF9843770.1 glycosyltransferase involved in cell wall biosynthesis [Paenibacillus sp. PastF-2]MDF9850391.1 glycosyltransferase involved in cell wall biosynthesis [Paenibacillus sp. PastM-2]MDF9856906.1 glycosyltransferase involved in cell wall biosynthesis [Paenibacillus sp. PastF-1]MDH6482237.1 glycosyltransferase involved in cell wall biosynthesis [Paenibacillus sp. PastH-2]MDH6509599.1 glycosyltransferase inv
MDPKVSIVIPCYNKGKYMYKMLDSIIAQKWDNIELILVNDGSTDNTHHVILGYEPELKARGFEVIIIEQENRGLPAAVHEGLKRISGEFVCQVDADDELEPEYVSTMAGWLSSNPEYDYAVCDFWYVYNDRTVYHNYCKAENHEKILSNLPESFFFGRIADVVWNYMVRSEYLINSGMIDHYFYAINRTQEPQYVLPLVANGGKIKYFPIPLYRYVQNEMQMSIRKTIDDYEKYNEQYHKIVDKTIEWLSKVQPQNKRLPVLAELSRLRRMLLIFERFNQTDSFKLQLLRQDTINLVNNVFAPSPQINEEHVANPHLLFAAIIDNILENKPKNMNFRSDRIIAWGALGKNGRSVLGNLYGTSLEPHELWDKGGDGAFVKIPDVESLSVNDTVLVLPSNYEIVLEISKTLQKIGCIVFTYDEILTYAASIRFPDFYNDSIELSPEGADSCNLK